MEYDQLILSIMTVIISLMASILTARLYGPRWAELAKARREHSKKLNDEVFKPCIEVWGGARGLKDALNSLIPTNGRWEVEERNGDYYATYVKSDGTKQPTLIIDDGGMILCDEKDWKSLDYQYIRHQASILISLLKKLRLTSTAKKYFSFNKYGTQIKEDIPAFHYTKLT